MVVLVACVFFARKTLFANRISRRLTWLSTFAIGLSFVSDGLTWLNRGNSRAAGLHAMMLLAACMSMGAVVLLPSLWWAAAILLAAAVTSAAFPVLTAAAVPLATMLTLIIVVAITLRHARRGEHLPADL
jgi:hypothetical protein